MILGAWFFSRPVALFLLLPLAFVVWFFRDPERVAPADPSVWVSPADGKVVEIERTYHPFVGEVTKVGVFMSPLDVHVNRAPTAGTVAHLEYVPGKKWLAFAPKASEENERLYRACELAGILTSLENLMTFPFVAERVRRGTLRIHGWYFDMKAGKLLSYLSQTGTFEELSPLCPYSENDG